MQYVFLIIKGALMGAANVIPGVSGGTMALITGIFERLIRAIKSCDLTAVKLACTFQFKKLFEHIDFYFLCAIFGGALISIVSLAKVLEKLFESQERLVWSFFFGLILASVVFVIRTIKRFSIPTLITFLMGTGIALGVAFATPASQNESIPYLFICGAVAMCSMILPGLSGSYMLLLMGNYKLVMIDAIANFRLDILAPVGVGAIIGLILFSHVLAWVLKRFHDQTIGLLSGFILGSLAILWPWKETLIETFTKGDELKEKVIGYEYLMPQWNIETLYAAGLIALGIALIFVIERLAQKK